MLQEFSHCPQCLSLRQVQLLPLQQQQLTHHCCPQLSASFVVSCQFPPLCRFHSRRLIYISNHFARHSERGTYVEILLHNAIVISKHKIKILYLCRSVCRVYGTASHGEFVKVRFADHDRACILGPLNHCGGIRSRKIVQHFWAARGFGSSDAKIVLDSNWYSWKISLVEN